MRSPYGACVTAFASVLAADEILVFLRPPRGDSVLVRVPKVFVQDRGSWRAVGDRDGDFRGRESAF